MNCQKSVVIPTGSLMADFCVDNETVGNTIITNVFALLTQVQLIEAEEFTNSSPITNDPKFVFIK